jgi:pimeloyl-ACP methyl ester carboxylesterase
MAWWTLRGTLHGTAALLIGTVLALGLPEPRAALADPVIAVVGNLATASRIAVLVPGSDTTPANFTSGLGGVLRRAPAWQASQLAAAAGPDTAAVAWLGYRTPHGIGRTAIRSERARTAADALVTYVAQLSRDCPHATIVLVGHSYGSVVLRYAAARLPASVTDLVAIGSPGMDAGSVDDLGTTARLWAGSAPTDWTRRIPPVRVLGAGHGRHPTDRSFGALPLDVHDADGHDGYFVPGTVALASIAGVVDASVAVTS